MTPYVDLPMDLADASLVLLAGELGHGRIVSTDKRDFHTYRWKTTSLLQICWRGWLDLEIPYEGIFVCG